MKRELLTIIMLICIPSITIASEKMSQYIKVFAGVNKMTKTNRTMGSIKYRLNSEINPFVGGAFGLYITENIRSDIGVTYFVSPELNSSTFSTLDENDNTQKTKLQHNAYIVSIMNNFYFDLFSFNLAKFYVGGGIGVTSIKEKVKVINIGKQGNNASISTKNVFNPTYAIILGSSIPVTPFTNIEIEYNYKDFGRTKPKKIDGQDQFPKTEYKGHNILVGVRFDI